MFYPLGRLLQLLGLLTMPAAMWVAEFQHDERGSIGIFVGAGAVFLIGFFLTETAKKT